MTGWNYDMSQAPKGRTETRTITVRGKQVDKEQFVKEWVFIALEDGHLTQSYWIPDGERWCYLTKGQMPIAWHPFPKHPGADQ